MKKFKLTISLFLLLIFPIFSQELSFGKEFNPLEKVPVTILSLIIICGFILLLGKFFANNKINFNSKKLINIIDKKFLGNKQFLYIVEIAGKYFLLGVTEEKIQNLAEISEEKILSYLENKDLKKTSKNLFNDLEKRGEEFAG
ncbi:MAG: flagellar biosynthetic protein FliO [Armatimonadetes bacterium]|nr:flagellar biosynthetic protein FliO [Armatimonadota bacterium]